MKKTKIYAEVLEPEAKAQFDAVMALPCIVQGALMPDAHTGYVLPIGGVVAVKDNIFPSFVGYDIGCGMATMQFDIKASSVDLSTLYGKIIETIPVGFKTHSAKQDMGKLLELPKSSNISKATLDNASKQLGTLGGGNHFIELGEDENGYLWATIHSGSRKLGHTVAGIYMQKAAETPEVIEKLRAQFEENNQQFKEHNPLGYEKAVEKYIAKNMCGVKLEEANALLVDSVAGQDYIKDMEFCLEFALENRVRMLNKISGLLGSPKVLTFINRNHNHAEFKDGLWIHRKGATHAEDGMMGVIPGNMRDGCFVVRGKGHPDSMCSSSHGAGRVLSRKKAREQLSLEEYEAQMQGIYGTVSIRTLDEAPNAYKNIFEVMELQKDLVEVVNYLKPVLNVKAQDK